MVPKKVRKHHAKKPLAPRNPLASKVVVEILDNDQTGDLEEYFSLTQSTSLVNPIVGDETGAQDDEND